MKKSIFLLFGLNVLIITSFLSFNPLNVRAEQIKAWDDDWLMCRVDGTPSPSYREHTCFEGSQYVSCVEQDCTLA